MEGAVFYRNVKGPGGLQNQCADCKDKYRPSWKTPLEYRYGFIGHAMSYAEVAKELGCSKERVRQIELSALKKLQRNSRVMAAIRRLLED